jgi:hypothetical protein
MGKITLHVAQSVNTPHKDDIKDDDDNNFNHRRRRKRRRMRNSVNTKVVHFYGESLENLLHLLLQARDICIQVNFFSPDLMQVLLDSWKIQAHTIPKIQRQPAQIIPKKLGKKSEITAALQTFHTDFLNRCTGD